MAEPTEKEIEDFYREHIEKNPGAGYAQIERQIERLIRTATFSDQTGTRVIHDGQHFSERDMGILLKILPEYLSEKKEDIGNLNKRWKHNLDTVKKYFYE
jgi:hypothetical protein